MGCGSSAVVNGHRLPDISCKSAPFQAIPISKEHKKLIFQTWALVEPVKVLAGRKLFARLFEVNPNLQSTFPAFKGMELKDLLNSRSLYLHAKRVMSALEKAVSSLEDSETFTSYLTNLGDRHLPWNVRQEHFTVVGECLLWTLKDMLGPACTTEVAQAWTELFGYITKSMLDGIARAKAERS